MYGSFASCGWHCHSLSSIRVRDVLIDLRRTIPKKSSSVFLAIELR